MGAHRYLKTRRRYFSSLTDETSAELYQIVRKFMFHFFKSFFTLNELEPPEIQLQNVSTVLTDF